MEDIIKFVINNLELKIAETNFKHSISVKDLFLGFKIQIESSEKFSQFSIKKFKAYKKHKNMMFKKGTKEYEKFLKMIKWFGRKVVINVVNKKIFPKQYIVKEKELKKIIPETIQHENWFYNKHKHNKKINFNYNNPHKNQLYKLKKWINFRQDLINTKELTKMIGNDQTNKFNFIRKNMMKLIKKLIEPKTEKAYYINYNLIKKNPTKITYFIKIIKNFEIFFPKRQIINKLKKKDIINFKQMPNIIIQKTKLTDYEIINCYITIAKALLLYYGYTKNLNELKRLVH